MVSFKEVWDKFQRVCVGEGRYIGLVFRTPGKKTEFGTIAIIGMKDDLERVMAIARDIGQVCVAIVEFDKKESAWLNAKRSKRMAIIEAICGKIGAAGFQS